MFNFHHWDSWWKLNTWKFKMWKIDYPKISNLRYAWFLYFKVARFRAHWNKITIIVAMSRFWTGRRTRAHTVMTLIDRWYVQEGWTDLSHQRGLVRVSKDTTIPIPTQTQEAMGTWVRIPPRHTCTRGQKCYIYMYVYCFIT